MTIYKRGNKLSSWNYVDGARKGYIEHGVYKVESEEVNKLEFQIHKFINKQEIQL